MTVEGFARRLERVEQDIRKGATQPRLRYSSIDGGALEVKDGLGNIQGIVGTQFDGSVTLASVGGTPPVSPTMPLVTPVAGGLRIYWDGTYVDGSPTRMDFRRVTFHAVTDVDDLDVLDPAQIVGEVTIATGGEISVSLPYVEHFVFAVAWTDAGKFSVESDAAFGTPAFVTVDDLDPDVGIGGDGAVPTIPVDWELELGPLGLMSLMVTWDAVPNGADVVVYDVYAATAPIATLAAATYVGTTGGTGWSFGAIDGDPLEAETDYYVAIVVRDTDGPSTTYGTAGPSTVKRASTDSVDPGWTYLGPVSADQIRTGDLTATVAVVGELTTAGGGRRISISSADGLRAVDPSGDTVAHIPTDLSQDISMQADLVAKSVTALGSVAMRAADNELAQNATLILRSATSAPVTAPTASIEWGNIATGAGMVPDWAYAGHYHAGSNRVYQAESVWGNSSVQWFNATSGAYIDRINIGAGPFSGAHIDTLAAARYGDVIYALVRHANGDWRIQRFDAITKGFIGEYMFGTDALFPYGNPSMTVNAGGELVIVYAGDNAGQVGYVRRLSLVRDTGAVINNYALDLYAPGGIASLYEGSADTGATRIWFQSGVYPGVFIAMEGGGARYAALDFPTAYGHNTAALWWDEGREKFVSYSRINGYWHVYDGTTWTTESSTWFVSNTWRDNDATGGTHETKQGPLTQITMKKRARLSVTTPPIPSDADNNNHDDPNAVSIYVGRGNGSYTTQWRQAAPATGVRTAVITDAIFSNADTNHPNPPQFGDFPNLVPARIQSDSGVYYFDGDGHATLNTLSVTGRSISKTAPVVIVPANGWVTFDAPGGPWQPTYEKIDGIVYVRGLVKTSGSSSAVIFNLPSVGGFRPLRNHMFTSTAGGAVAPGLEIRTNGDIVFPGGVSNATGYVSIEAHFPAA